MLLVTFLNDESKIDLNTDAQKLTYSTVQLERLSVYKYKNKIIVKYPYNRKD